MSTPRPVLVAHPAHQRPRPCPYTNTQLRHLPPSHLTSPTTPLPPPRASHTIRTRTLHPISSDSPPPSAPNNRPQNVSGTASNAGARIVKGRADGRSVRMPVKIVGVWGVRAGIVSGRIRPAARLGLDQSSGVVCCMDRTWVVYDYCSFPPFLIVGCCMYDFQRIMPNLLPSPCL